MASQFLTHVAVFLLSASLAQAGVTAARDPLINEWVADHTGADVYEFVEIFGDPSTSYSTYAVLVVEGDSSQNPGRIDLVIPVGATTAGGVWTSSYFSSSIEDGTLTLLLAEAFAGVSGNDLDVDDDGVFDTAPWSRLVDCVATSDGGPDLTYCAVVLTPGFDGENSRPAGASRIPDGADSGSAADWLRNDFSGEGLPGLTGTPLFGEAFNTPGAANAAVPGPAASLLMTIPASAAGGSPFELTVTAVDSRGTIATGYAGTIELTSSDGLAVLPSNYTFTTEDAGVHTFSVTCNTAGTVTITATDVVTASVTGSSAVSVIGSTTTAISSSVNPSSSGQSVTLTATVTSATSGTITGSVAFKDGTSALGSGTLSGGIATLTTATLEPGQHSITAEYEGSADFTGSTSAVLMQEVRVVLVAPSSLTATATTASQVEIAWQAVAGASYELYRATTLADGYSLIESTSATSYVDGGRSGDTTYLYKVRAVSGGEVSPFSSVDVATTTIFTDPVLTTSIAVRAIHLTELRTALNALRAAASLPLRDFGEAPVAGQTVIERSHLIELREALDEARAIFGFPATNYTDPLISAGSTRIKAAHFMEVRTGVQ